MISRKLLVKKPFYKKGSFWLFLFFSFIFLLFCGSFFLLPQFHLKEIEIESPPEINKIECEKFAISFFSRNFLKKPHLFLRGSKAFKIEFLNSFPAVKTVEVKKLFPSKLLIKIHPKEKKFLFCQQNKDCYFIDEKGMIFQKFEGEKHKFPIIELFDANLELKVGMSPLKAKEMENIFQIQNTLGKFQILIRQIFLFPEKVEVFTEQDFKIIFDFQKDFTLQLAKLEVFLEKERESMNWEYIDLRFDNQVFVKPKK